MSDPFKPTGEFTYAGRWVLWLILAFILLGGLGYVFKYTNIIVERKVYEQSYQYKAGTERQAATWEASIAEIERRLLGPGLTPAERNNLEAQLSALRIQLTSIVKR